MNSNQLEHRIQEANITYYAKQQHPNDLYLQFRYYNTLREVYK